MDQDQNILPLTLKHILSIVDVGNWRLHFRLHLRYLYLFKFQVLPQTFCLQRPKIVWGIKI